MGNLHTLEDLLVKTSKVAGRFRNIEVSQQDNATGLKVKRATKVAGDKVEVSVPFASAGHIPHPRKEAESSWTPRPDLNRP